MKKPNQADAAHEHSHEAEAIRIRLENGTKPSYLRDFVYGGIDGVVTTFAIVSGVEGASLSPSIILILGFANLLADGFSMAASNYSGAKTVVDDAERLRSIERKHVRLVPDGEREEVRQILRSKGLSGKTLEDAVEAITRNEERWVEFMVAEEYGMGANMASPLVAGLATFAAFLVCGIVPLIPFALGMDRAFLVASIATALVFIAIGAAKSVWSTAPWWRSALETMLIGGGAAVLAYAVGYGLRSIAV